MGVSSKCTTGQLKLTYKKVVLIILLSSMHTIYSGIMMTLLMIMANFYKWIYTEHNAFIQVFGGLQEHNSAL